MRKHCAAGGVSLPLAGQSETAMEWLLLIKTQANSYERLHDAIKELHSYDLPECVMLEVDAGSHEYLKWIAESTS